MQQHSGNISSALLGHHIGYINIKGTDSMKDAEKAISNALDHVYEEQGIVIDIRGFYGGSDAVSQLIAGHFTDDRKLYMTTRKRNGPAHNNFTEAESWFVEPHGKKQYLKPIILLTSRFSQSAAETFTLAMNELEHVTLLGDTTAGSLSDNPTTEMYNGWMFSVSVGDFRDARGKSYEGTGIAPDSWLVNSKEDLLAGKDPVLEKAIDLLK
jgi:C-terminal processing protease CtpA/Prc